VSRLAEGHRAATRSGLDTPPPTVTTLGESEQSRKPQPGTSRTRPNQKPNSGTIQARYAGVPSKGEPLFSSLIDLEAPRERVSRNLWTTTINPPPNRISAGQPSGIPPFSSLVDLGQPGDRIESGLWTTTINPPPNRISAGQPSGIPPFSSLVDLGQPGDRIESGLWTTKRRCREGGRLSTGPGRSRTSPRPRIPGHNTPPPTRPARTTAPHPAPPTPAPIARTARIAP